MQIWEEKGKSKQTQTNARLLHQLSALPMWANNIVFIFMEQEVGSGRMLSLGYPLWLIAFLATNISLVYYSFREQALWNM